MSEKINRYTDKEWEKLSSTQKLGRLHLAPIGEKDLIKDLADAFTNDAPLGAAYAMKKVELAINTITDLANSEDIEDLAKILEVFELSNLEVVLLILMQNKKSKEKTANPNRRTNKELWQKAVLEIYTKEELEHKTLDSFCHKISTREVKTQDGQQAKTPSAEEIKRYLTAEKVELYKRENGIYK